MRSSLQEAVDFDRVSSAEQRKGFSLEAQADAKDVYAKKMNLKVVRRWSVDESASKEGERKHFFEAIDYVKTNSIKHFVFDKVERACRGFKSAVLIEELIDEFDVRCHFVRDSLIIDRNSQTSDKLRFYLGIILGKFYIDNLKVEIKKGRDARIKAGLWNGKAPVGYKNFRDPKSGRADVAIDPDTSPAVKEIFTLYSTGNYGLESLATQLSAKTNRTYSKRTIEELIGNPFYIGAMRINGGVTPGAHESLISKDLWDACQKIRGLRAAARGGCRTNLIPKPLMGLMKCGKCSHAITGQAKIKKSGITFVYYHCANAKCGQSKVYSRQEDLFEQINAAFEPFKHFTPKATRAFIEGIQACLSDFDLYTRLRTNELTERRARIKDQVAKLERLHNQGQLSDQEYEAVKAMRNEALNEVVVEMGAENKADQKLFEEGCHIIELLTKVRDFMKLSPNLLDKVRLAKLVLSNPTLLDKNLCFHYQKPFDDLIELVKVPVWWRRRESNPGPSKRRNRYYMLSPADFPLASAAHGPAPETAT